MGWGGCDLFQAVPGVWGFAVGFIDVLSPAFDLRSTVCERRAVPGSNAGERDYGAARCTGYWLNVVEFHRGLWWCLFLWSARGQAADQTWNLPFPRVGRTPAPLAELKPRSPLVLGFGVATDSDWTQFSLDVSVGELTCVYI